MGVFGAERKTTVRLGHVDANGPPIEATSKTWQQLQQNNGVLWVDNCLTRNTPIAHTKTRSRKIVSHCLISNYRRDPHVAYYMVC